MERLGIQGERGAAVLQALSHQGLPQAAHLEEPQEEVLYDHEAVVLSRCLTRESKINEMPCSFKDFMKQSCKLGFIFQLSHTHTHTRKKSTDQTNIY